MSHRGSTRAELGYRRLSSPMLEEAFQAHGQSGHRFTKKTFTRPTYCHHCTEMLWGFTNQGYACEGKLKQEFFKAFLTKFFAEKTLDKVEEMYDQFSGI